MSLSICCFYLLSLFSCCFIKPFYVQSIIEGLKKKTTWYIWSVDAEFLKILEAVTSHLKHLCMYVLTDWLIDLDDTYSGSQLTCILFIFCWWINQCAFSCFWGQFIKHCLRYFPSYFFVPFRKRNDTSIKEAEKKRSGCQEILNKLQQQYQQFLTKAAAKA